MFSTDPELVAKVTDVVRLYLAPPQNAVVRCVDEKSQIQVNLVEIWFGIIECQAIHRGSFANVTDLTRRIHAFIDG